MRAGEPSNRILFAGYARRSLHLAHNAAVPVKFTLEVDAAGDGKWQTLREVTVPAAGSEWLEFSAQERGQWIRLRTDRDCERATAFFHYANPDPRPPEADPMFAGLVTPRDAATSGGLLRARGDERNMLSFAATIARKDQPADERYYEMDAGFAARASR